MLTTLSCLYRTNMSFDSDKLVGYQSKSCMQDLCPFYKRENYMIEMCTCKRTRETLRYEMQTVRKIEIENGLKYLIP